MDVLYVTSHALHVKRWALSRGHPVVGHSGVSVPHHHVVGVARYEHGLRVDWWRELCHLSVGGRRCTVHVRPVHALHTQHIVPLAGVQVRVASLHGVV